jgi:hypothetical protein
MQRDRFSVSLAGSYQPIGESGNPIGKGQAFCYSGFVLRLIGNQGHLDRPCQSYGQGLVEVKKS